MRRATSIPVGSVFGAALVSACGRSKAGSGSEQLPHLLLLAFSTGGTFFILYRRVKAGDPGGKKKKRK